MSKLWHVLRVIPVPATWIKKIKSHISQYLTPFWPRPSWSTMCLQRKHGGLNLINIIYQQYTLHLVYLQKLLKTSKRDFVTPILRRCIQIHTAHKSIFGDNHVPTEVQNVSIRHTDISSFMHFVDETTRT
jgi:hypothetical protein